ncbi:NUDIX domain-containing protein [Actinomadura viridis]|uniref:NUDIX domain-containing protein n=1 Tax=Actinomadura viridis TaxID=58110 RepID=UPI0036748660
MLLIIHPTASAVILADGQVLLLKSAKGAGYIYPGGHVGNEDPATAVIREVREETDLDIELIYEPRFSHPKIKEVPLPFTIMDLAVHDKRIGRHRHVDAVYVARPKTNEVVLNHESDGYLWVPVSQVTSLPVPDELPDLIAAAAKYAAALSP